MRFVQLSDVCDLQNGFAFKSTDYVEKSNTCNIRMSNIRPGGSFNEFHNERYLPDSYAKEYKDYLLNNGDLIIAMTDMATETKILGLPTLVNNTSGRRFLLNQRVGKLCKFSKDIYVPYLRHILTAQDVIDYYKSKGAGGLQINISKKDILSVKFPLPAIPTQQKIVAKLDAVFAEIDKATAAAEANARNAEALFQSYLTEVFERDSEGWNTAKLKDVVSELITGPFGSALHKSDYVESGIPVINPQNLINGKIIPLEKTMVSQFTKERLKKYSLKIKDIVIARRGEMGRCGLVDFETEGWLCGTGSMIIRLNEKANENFIFQLLQSNRVRKELESSSIGATMSNLNQSILLDIQFTLPPIEFQIKTIESIKEVSLKSAELTKSYLNKVNEYSFLKQSILKQAFSGELVKE